MSELVPASSPALTSISGSPADSPLTRLRGLAGQNAVRRALPLLLGVAAIGAAGLTWAALSPAPQRTLFAQLDDSERASVAGALDKAAISYRIDNATGALTVGEDDFYRARMLVASDGALATPESGAAMLDSLPMGASRTLEGERLRSARERDLMLTIQEIDGVETVRVHLAEAERSVFVRDNLPPSASVMLRLARGRQLSDSQVSAIVNLVAGSVPGLTPEAVRVVDQHGRLLSDKTQTDSDRLDMQARLEEKLRGQVAQLLTPMLGEGNFTTEIQVELDMDQVTSARESYDKNGVVRSETQAQSSSNAPAPAAGIPGALSNTPPPPATATPGPPQGTLPAPAQPGSANGEASSTRTYELGREVAVANTAPGKLKRLSVAVAISGKAMKNTKADIDQVKQLVSAAVGADSQRGDQVAVVSRGFSPVKEAPIPFYEASWFATVVRNAVALLAVLLVLLLGVRPLIKALRRDAPAAGTSDPAETTDGGEADVLHGASPAPPDPELLSRQVGLAQRMVAEQPESAVAALRQMLGPPAEGAR